MDSTYTPHLHHGRHSAILNQVVEERRIYTFTKSLSSFSITFARDLALGLSRYDARGAQANRSLLSPFRITTCYLSEQRLILVSEAEAMLYNNATMGHGGRKTATFAAVFRAGRLNVTTADFA